MDISELPNEEQLSTMSFSDIRTLRSKVGDDNKEAQNLLASYDRRSYAREWVESGGIGAAAKAAVLVPLEPIAKAVGITSGRSDPSVEGVKQGFIGIGEGLQRLFDSDEENKIKREVSPEVEQYFKSKEQANKLIEALVQTESSGRHTTEDGTLVTSNKGAKGITQVMSATAKNPGYGIKPIQNDSEEEYRRFGRDYLTKMIHIFDNVEQGVAAYNAGPGAIHRAISKASRTGRDWKEFIPSETKAYIKKVTTEI